MIPASSFLLHRAPRTPRPQATPAVWVSALLWARQGPALLSFLCLFVLPLNCSQEGYFLSLARMGKHVAVCLLPPRHKKPFMTDGELLSPEPPLLIQVRAGHLSPGRVQPLAPRGRDHTQPSPPETRTQAFTAGSARRAAGRRRFLPQLPSSSPPRGGARRRGPGSSALPSTLAFC